LGTKVEDLLIQSDAGDGRTSAVFEDDGDVAYCYVMVEGEIRSDVWVYNRRSTPVEKPWEKGASPPHLNPKEYAFEMDRLPASTADVSIDWQMERASSPVALVTIYGELLASVSADAKPGYARLARKDGPLAKPLLRIGRNPTPRKRGPAKKALGVK
jgi:hypothetical protein